MVSLVLVSHSYTLANAAMELAKGVNQNVNFPMACAGGAGEDHKILGTDAAAIMEAIMSVYSDDGVLVLMDLGSAIISTKLALDMLGDGYEKIRLCPAPLVEGAVSAAVQIIAGSPLDEICAEAVDSLAAKQEVLSILPVSKPDNKAINLPDEHAVSYTFRMGLIHGLHARPAAEMVNTVAPFKSTVTAQNLTRQTPMVNAKSLNKLALSNIAFGDEVRVRATGEDANAAIEAVKHLVHVSFAADAHDQTGGIPAPAKKMAIENPLGKLAVMSQGIAMGIVHSIDTTIKNIPPQTVTDTNEEVKRLDRAVDAVYKSISATKLRLTEQGLTQEAAIFDAHLMILNDSEILEDVKHSIKEEKLSAEYTYQDKMSQLAGEFSEIDNEYMRERATDVADVARQVVAQLTGTMQSVDNNSDDIILAAHEVTPSLLIRFDRTRLKGILTETGGVSSHVAILAKAMSIPAITGIKLPNDITDKTAVMDTSCPEVIFGPTSDVVKRYETLIADWETRKKADMTDSQGQAWSLDGTHIPVYGNVGDQTTAIAAKTNGADGIGLLRTEFMFLNSRQEPSEKEQAAAFRNIFSLFGNNPITVRTLDIGGDKHPHWLPLPKEENPFLGVRGIRLCMQKKDLFLRQLRAILQAANGYDGVKIMIPMISVPEEVHFARTMLQEAHSSLERDGIMHRWPIPLGIMIETPSAVLLADYLAKISDFFSIGTNDLNQYIMCAERGGSVFDADLTDMLQPPVLKAIEAVAAATKRHQIELSVCGEMAGNPLAAKILLGLGVNMLSMNGSSIGGVKRMIRKTALKSIEKQAYEAVLSETPQQVKEIFKDLI